MFANFRAQKRSEGLNFEKWVFQVFSYILVKITFFDQKVLKSPKISLKPFNLHKYSLLLFSEGFRTFQHFLIEKCDFEDGDPFCDLQDLVESIYVIADSLKPSIAMDFIVRVLRETSDCEVEHAFEKVVYWALNLVSFSLSILKFSMAMISIAILVFLAE